MERRFSSFVGSEWRKELATRYPDVVFRPQNGVRSRRTSSVAVQNGGTNGHRMSAVPSLMCVDEYFMSGAHPMTVALATPPPKVDYSVTKGGARTWAVLLVFMFLCSSLYTVFSAKEIAELAVDLDGDGTVDLDDDVTDNLDEVAEQQRRTARATMPSTPQQHDRVHPEIHKGAQESIPSADSEEEEGPEELESQLFAGLRKKIEKNMKKVQEMIQNKEDASDEEEEEEPKVMRQPRRHRKKVVKEEVEEEPKRRVNNRKRKIEVEEEEEEEEEEEKKVDEEEDEEEEEEEEKKEEEEEKTQEEEEVQQEEEEEEEEEVPQRQRKGKRRHSARSITADVPERECRRKHCPQANTAEPRRGLLKRKKGESGSNKRYKQMSRAQIEEFEDDEEEEEEEEETEDKENESEEEIAPTHEVIALKKYRSSGREAYKRHAITNRDDHRHREQLDQADFLVEKHNYEAALALFDSVLRVNPDSPRAHFGKGRAFDIRSEYLANERDADLAIKQYEYVLDNDETPDALFRQAASRLIEKARFRGQMHRCLMAQRSLIDRFPDEIKLQTDLGLSFLMMKRYDDARRAFKDIIDVHPNNAVALAYYGFTLKVCDHDLEGGVAYMRRGLRLGGESIIDPKFYYHLGQGLMVLGRTSEAYSVYEKGAELGLFLSAQQRSIYNMEGLTGRAWWTLEQTSYGKHLKALERNWVAIRHEAMRALNDVPDKWEDANPAITVDGQWKTFSLMDDGFFDEEHCEVTPQTCAILREFRAQSHNATKSDMFLSVLTSGTQILPHCGASNTRLQAQMGLVVPSEARIRVGNDQRGWKTGKFIIFDDSFEHAMHFDGASSSAFRLVLTIDLWHPEVDMRLRTNPEQ